MTDLTPTNQGASTESQEEAIEDAATAAATHPPHALTRTAYVVLGLDMLRHLKAQDKDMHPCHPPSRHPPVTMYEFRDKVRAKWFQMTPDAEERLLVRAVSETAGAVTEELGEEQARTMVLMRDVDVALHDALEPPPCVTQIFAYDWAISRVIALPEIWTLLAKYGVGVNPGMSDLYWAVQLTIVCQAARIRVMEWLSTLRDADLRGNFPYHGNSLTSLPAAFMFGPGFSALEFLRLDCNRLTTLPATLGNFSLLADLDLSTNRLTSLPAEIGGLSSLIILHLYGNLLPHLPAELGRLSLLTDLWVQDNRLTCVPAQVGDLVSLVDLRLENNQLASVPAELGRLTSLEELRLETNKLLSIPTELGTLRSLEVLNVSNNQLVSVPSELGSLSSLERLNLSCNRLESIPASFGALISLQRLILRENELTDLPAQFAELTALEVLDLSDNDFDQIPDIPVELLGIAWIN